MKLNALRRRHLGARPRRLGVPREGLRRCCPVSASSSAPRTRPSPSACAACASAPTTGSPSPAIPEEVAARLEAVVRRRRRSQPKADAGPVVVGEVEIRSDQFQAFVSGRSLDLTRREFELLSVLAEANGKVIEREEIYQRVWGYEMAHGDRSVDVFIRKLRAKLQKDSPGWSYIHTHFGVGYRFEPEHEAGGGRPAALPSSAEETAADRRGRDRAPRSARRRYPDA